MGVDLRYSELLQTEVDSCLANLERLADVAEHSSLQVEVRTLIQLLAKLEQAKLEEARRSTRGRRRIKPKRAVAPPPADA